MVYHPLRSPAFLDVEELRSDSKMREAIEAFHLNQLKSVEIAASTHHFHV